MRFSSNTCIVAKGIASTKLITEGSMIPINTPLIISMSEGPKKKEPPVAVLNPITMQEIHTAIAIRL